MCLLENLRTDFPFGTRFLQREKRFRQNFSHRSLKFRDHNGLCKESVESLPQEHLICRTDSIGREGYDRHFLFLLGIHSANALHGFHSVHTRHHMIHENEINLMVPYILDRFRSGRYRTYFHAVA